MLKGNNFVGATLNKDCLYAKSTQFGGRSIVGTISSNEIREIC